MIKEKSQWCDYTDTSHKPVYIVWFMTNGCNYKCSYCFYRSHSGKEPLYNEKSLIRNPFAAPYIMKRLKSKNNFKHAFLNYSPEEWLKAFERLAPRSTVLKMTGGEPFLDADNFKQLLDGLNQMEHIKSVRIDTNSSFNPEKFISIKESKIGLNISYHPKQITLDSFEDKIKKILDTGISIAMVNFVLSPSQLDEFERVKERMDKLGVFTNANIFVETDGKQVEYGYELYKKYNTQMDIDIKTGKVKTLGKKCSFPSFGYQMNPAGIINVGCYNFVVSDFVNKGLPRSFNRPMPCSRVHCGCIDQYAFLEGFPKRGNSFDLLGEYVEDVRDKLKL